MNLFVEYFISIYEFQGIILFYQVTNLKIARLCKHSIIFVVNKQSLLYKTNMFLSLTFRHDMVNVGSSFVYSQHGALRQKLDLCCAIITVKLV